MCFRCGDKYSPAHKCQKTPQGQIQAIQAQEIMSDEVLDVVVVDEEEEVEMHLSLNAALGSDHPRTIRRSNNVNAN